ncbi:hypothetical protein DL765_008226 [Monosporascus sp. GIB2]|nr:hypothetical protein DL765_008226 [Monosporascus sp. GIB2]
MQDQQLVVVITGAGRVVGGIRNDSSPGVTELKASSLGAGSKLLLVKLESSSLTDAKSAMEQITAAGIDHIDIVIANAGLSPPVAPLETVDLEEVASVLKINALGPLALYQASHSLLEKSKNAKFVSISSAAGSIATMESIGSYVAPAYSISKAALNWITLAAHCGNKWLTAFAVNPGLVATDMGNRTARYLGMERAPYTKEYSAERVISLYSDWDSVEETLASNNEKLPIATPALGAT